MKREKGLWKASNVFAPTFPRQVSTANTIQERRDTRVDFCDALDSAIDNGMPGYYSVYSFPRGHSQDGSIPKVDCIFIDLDVEGGDYDPTTGDTDFEAWRRDMSDLLVRARMIARAILDGDQEEHFRAVLSGHKGLHLYLDFPTIATSNGDFMQFKNGLKRYGESVMEWLDEAAGGLEIENWVDVDASDLGRLARHPNTIHHGAQYDGETRWCVPVTIEELADLDVDGYLKFTREPRWPDEYARYPSETAGNKVVQAIRNAPSEERKQKQKGSSYDPSAIKEYDKQANENITLDDIDFLTSNKPCIKKFRHRDDAFGYGNASHTMELNIIARLVDMEVPRDVIHEFFEDLPGYEAGYTDEQIDKIIGRQYSEFNCQNIANDAPMFCLGSDCAIYNRSDDIQK